MYNNRNARPLYKLLLLCLCTILTTFVFSQTVWSESFLDSNFTTTPVWQGDTSSFEISVNKELQLAASAVPSSKFVYTNSTAIWEASWEFRVKYGFNPSTNNYSNIYFAGHPGLQNGYYIALGGNSQDRFSLRKTENSSSTTLIQSTAGWLDNSYVDIKIKVTRDQSGRFTLFADTSGAYSIIGSTTDSSFYTSSVFAWECVYSSTRSDKFFLDDIIVSGKIYQDSIPPKITGVLFLDSNTLELVFSEPIDTISLSSLADFVLAPNGVTPLSVFSSGSKSIALNFASSFTNRTHYFLWVEGVRDLFLNPVQDTTIDLFYLSPTWGDVTLSEIMFDPSPPVQLPNHEYLELFNASLYDISLEGWFIRVGNNSITLPKFTFHSNDYLLIADSSVLSAYNIASGLGVDWPSGFLPNIGAEVSLHGPNGTLVYFAEYSTTSFTNPNKSKGGWSLENNSVTSSCISQFLWDESENQKGGTPGEVNSITSKAAPSFPIMEYIVYRSPQHIEVVFSEVLDSFYVQSSLPIQHIYRKMITSNSLDVRFANSMQPNTLYEIDFSFASGCFGQNDDNQILRFGIPTSAEVGDVLINEILFNPTDKNSDFVEIINTSENCLVLNALSLAQIHDVDGLPDKVENIAADSVLLAPNEFWVFTEEKNSLISFHNLSNNAFVFECNLPSMPDVEGSIGVCTSSLEWVDKLSYTSNWHHELISNEEDVSLERVNLGTNTQQSSNWHSATYNSGYATPTQVNSQTGNFSSSGSITLSTDLLTPNNDGIDDILSINFSLNKSGWVGSILVFDAFGRETLSLLNNKPVGPNHTIFWHGLGKNEARIKRGAYIIYIELWHPDGEKIIVKKSVGVYYEG